MGERGPAGPKGQDGTVEFDKLSEEQLKKIKGDPGPAGPEGPAGPTGPRGEGVPPTEGIADDRILGIKNGQVEWVAAPKGDAYTKDESDARYIIKSEYPQTNNLNNVYETGFAKTSETSAKGLPQECQWNDSGWGVIFTIKENPAGGPTHKTCVQMYFPVMGPQVGSMYLRGSNEIGEWTRWNKTATTEVNRKVDELEEQLTLLTLKYERLLTTLGVEDDEDVFPETLYPHTLEEPMEE